MGSAPTGFIRKKAVVPVPTVRSIGKPGKMGGPLANAARALKLPAAMVATLVVRGGTGREGDDATGVPSGRRPSKSLPMLLKGQASSTILVNPFTKPGEPFQPTIVPL